MKRVGIIMDDEIHKAAKINAIMKNESLNQYVVDLIRKNLETKKEQSR